VSLTVGRAPFGPSPTGTFNFAPPERVVFVEPLGRRVRGVRHGEVVVDSDDTKLVHVTGRLPRYVFPAKHVRIDAQPHPDVDGHVLVDWDAVDAWFEEDERVLVHPRDPYSRIDTFATSRRIEVRIEHELVASSTRAIALYETSLPVRYYVPRADVQVQLLRPSPTVTECAYKGTARHWSALLHGREVADVAWTYDDEVHREAEPVHGLIAFYNERVDLDVDGVKLERPQTQWSR
jgi:uncharacterized protein (DUF427 family)